MSVDFSLWDSMFGITSTVPSTTPTTTPAPPTTPTATPTVAPTPYVDCAFWDADLIAYEFEIYNIEGGWVTDGGASLEKQEQGCGALTFWNWVPATSTTFAYVHFYLPVLIAAGCVERAIVSAGGPKTSCQGQGVTGGLKRNINGELEERQIEPMAAEYLPPTNEQVQVLQSVYTNVTVAAEPYVPMNWSGVSKSSDTEGSSSTPTV
jgi:chitinase